MKQINKFIQKPLRQRIPPAKKQEIELRESFELNFAISRISKFISNPSPVKGDNRSETR